VAGNPALTFDAQRPSQQSDEATLTGNTGRIDFPRP
jgi:hypothetical protein